jgi:hypothetical protein
MEMFCCEGAEAPATAENVTAFDDSLIVGTGVTVTVTVTFAGLLTALVELIGIIAV